MEKIKAWLQSPLAIFIGGVLFLTTVTLVSSYFSQTPEQKAIAQCTRELKQASDYAVSNAQAEQQCVQMCQEGDLVDCR